MAILFPAQIDIITLPTVIDGTTPITAALFNNYRLAILAIEQELGLIPSGTYSTVRARLDALENLIDNLSGGAVLIAGDIGGTPSHPLVIGLQGNPISPITPTTGQALLWDGIAWVPEDIIETTTDTTTLTGIMFLEIGQVLFNPIFNATYSEFPLAATIQDNVGNPVQNILLEPYPFTIYTFIYDQQYKYTSYSFPNFPSVAFTLEARGLNITSMTAVLITTWAQKLYYGTAPPGQSSASFIQSLNSFINGERAAEFTINSGINQAIYYAYPTSYGAADFWIDGWEGGFELVSTSISVTNAYGFTDIYTLYQSNQVNVGLTTINVF